VWTPKSTYEGSAMGIMEEDDVAGIEVLDI
jgi:hypothetical protein